MGVRTCETGSKSLKKPSRPPPAPPGPTGPPVPPKDSCLIQQCTATFNLLNYPYPASECGAESCYGSVKSVPYSTKSLQPNATYYYTSCSSARSDYGCFQPAAPEYCTPVQSTRRCCRSCCSCELSHCGSPVGSRSSGFAAVYRPCAEQVQHRNLAPTAMSCSQSTVGSSGQQASPLPPQAQQAQQTHMMMMSMSRSKPPITSKATPNVHQVLEATTSLVPGAAQASATLPPIPQERKLRPKLSISPIPILKRIDKTPNKFRCEPLTYKRHIEQHIERVFKYLSDRQKRLEECEFAIRTSPENLSPENEASIKKMLAHKETRHLRSLRTRLSKKDFEIIKELGKGYIGRVSLVQKVGTENLYAMKELRKSQVFRQNHMAHVMAERDILAEADNEWIVKLYHSFQDEFYLYFILEFIQGGDMMTLLQEHWVFPEEWARFYIAEISLAVQFVHDMHFIHRDIKPDNILIDAKGHIKLTDFGLCTGFRWTHDLMYYRDDTINNLHHGLGNHQTLDDHPTITKVLTQREIEYSKKSRSLSLVGSPNYIAPEVLRRDGTNERLCDWWSVGVILYEMVIGYCPFMDLDLIKNFGYSHELDPPDKIQQRILNWRHYLAFPSRNDPDSPPMMADKNNRKYEISTATKSLIEGWICDPNERLCQNGIQDIKEHPFFANINWNAIRTMPAPYVPQLNGPKDTQHFATSPQPQSIVEHGTIGVNPRMAMNDFTYHAFWNKPLNGVFQRA